jgi:hypothetical protein
MRRSRQSNHKAGCRPPVGRDPPCTSAAAHTCHAAGAASCTTKDAQVDCSVWTQEACCVAPNWPGSTRAGAHSNAPLTHTNHPRVRIHSICQHQLHNECLATTHQCGHLARRMYREDARAYAPSSAVVPHMTEPTRRQVIKTYHRKQVHRNHVVQPTMASQTTLMQLPAVFQQHYATQQDDKQDHFDKAPAQLRECPAQPLDKCHMAPDRPPAVPCYQAKCTCTHICNTATLLFDSFMW